MDTVSDPDRQRFARFWEGINEREIHFPKCDDCQIWHWYPLRLCPECGSARIIWQLVNGPVTLFSWTIIRHAFVPEWRNRLPYVVGLFEFADAPGVRLISNLIECDEGDIAVDLAVEPIYPTKLANEDPVVVFRPLIHRGPRRLREL